MIVHVNLSPGKYRLGGSALAQCYKQLGDSVPDLDDPSLLVKAFNITQDLIRGTVLVCFQHGCNRLSACSFAAVA